MGVIENQSFFFLVFANTCLALSICVQQDRGLGLLSAY